MSILVRLLVSFTLACGAMSLVTDEAMAVKRKLSGSSSEPEKSTPVDSSKDDLVEGGGEVPVCNRLTNQLQYDERMFGPSVAIGQASGEVNPTQLTFRCEPSLQRLPSLPYKEKNENQNLSVLADIATANFTCTWKDDQGQSCGVELSSDEPDYLLAHVRSHMRHWPVQQPAAANFTCTWTNDKGQACGVDLSSEAPDHLFAHVMSHTGDLEILGLPCGKESATDSNEERSEGPTGEQHADVDYEAEPDEGANDEENQQIPGSSRVCPCINANGKACEMLFALEKSSDFQEHVIKIHLTKGSKVCCFPTCGKTATRANDLRNHILFHTGHKPHPCSVCGKCFFTISNKLTHERALHTDTERSANKRGEKQPGSH